MRPGRKSEEENAADPGQVQPAAQNHHGWERPRDRDRLQTQSQPQEGARQVEKRSHPSAS